MPGRIFELSSLLLILVVSHMVNAEVVRTDTERVQSIIISDGSTRKARVLYSLGPVDLAKGDLIDLRVQAVVTSDCHGNTGVGRYLIRGDSSTAIYGKRIIKGVMSNTTRDIHHGVLVHSGIEQVFSPMINQYYNFIVFAQSIQCAGSVLQVEGYHDDSIGELVLIRQKVSASVP